METMRQENTQGYTDAELTALNAEWEQIATAGGLTPDTDAYYQRQKQFSDEVSRREHPDAEDDA